MFFKNVQIMKKFEPYNMYFCKMIYIMIIILYDIIIGQKSSIWLIFKAKLDLGPNLLIGISSRSKSILKHNSFLSV